jgi:hypothetical protein
MIQRSFIVLACVVSIFAAGFLVRAQVREPTLPPGTPLTQPTIFSGSELGFRVDSYRAGAPVGTFVVKVDGKWVAVSESLGVKRLTQR